MTESLLISLALIAVLGIASQWVAWRLGLPSILILLLTGIVVGPVLGWVKPDQLLGDLLFPLVSLSVALILFEGGLTLHLKELRTIGPAVLRLCTIGVLCTWIGAGLGAHYIAGLGWPLAILMGAILTVTGPTVVGPLLRQIRPRGPVGPIANWEGIVSDVIGATLAVLVFHAILVSAQTQHVSVGHSLASLGLTLAVGILAGITGAVFLGWPLRKHWIPDHLHSPVALVLVLGVYAIADHFASESGLLAVTLMGIALRNQKSTPVAHIIEFKENIRTLLISVLFITLTARIQPEDLGALGLRDFAFVVFLILVVRPGAVTLATLGSNLRHSERRFLAGLAPRGIVAAAVSALFAQELTLLGGDHWQGLERFAPLAFLVIVVSVVVYGIGARPLARHLGLAEREPQGVLILGVHAFSKALSKALQKAGVQVLMVDSNRAAVIDANLEGHNALCANALSMESHDTLPLGGIGHLLALTSNDEVNALVCLHYRELFGRRHCFQVRPQPGTENRAGGAPPAAPIDLLGRLLFKSEASLARLHERLARGEQVRVRHLDSDDDLSHWASDRQTSELALCTVNEMGHLRMDTAQSPLQPARGEHLVYLE